MKQVTSAQNLGRAWKRCRNDRAHWLPGQARREIENHLYTHLLQLGEDLRKGRYQPAPLRCFTLQKGNGELRTLAALALRDKVAQRAVLQVLQPLAEKSFHSDSFGYRPGRNVVMAQARARTYLTEGDHWVAHTDLKDCFDRIPLAGIRRLLRQQVRDRRLRKLINAWLKAHATTPGRWWRRARGLPQGGILSPLLTNWYLTQLDDQLSRDGIRFVRYGDDILLCCPGRRQARRALKRLARAARSLGLKLNRSKTQIERAGPGVIFLGEPLPRF